MIIAVNTRDLSGSGGGAKLFQPLFEEIARQHPEHSFAFISNKPFGADKESSDNILYYVIEQRSSNPLLWKIWYNYKLPSLLRKLKAGLLINTDGICSLRTKLPQFVFVNEMASKLQQSWYTKKYHHFMLANQPVFLQKAAHVFASTNLLRQQIIEQHKIDSQKMSVLYPVADANYQPLEWAEKEQVKEQYTQGKDYFFFSGSLQQQSNLINLLKAFSFFKRRQKSNMQLVIATESTTGDDGFTTSLETYKYRKEVVLLQNLELADLLKITGAAYAVVNLSRQGNNVTQLVNAIQCNVPVLVSHHETHEELFADAALYADPDSFEDIADKMMLLFKDEDRRAKFIEQGKQLLQNFNLQKTVDALWQTILSAIQ